MFQKIKLAVKKLPHFKGDLPKYETAGASGMDVRAQLDAPVTLKPGERALIPTGLTMEIPTGYEIQVRPRSGLAAKHGIAVSNSPGTVDSDYRGEVKIILTNLGTAEFSFQDQDRVAQLVLCPVLHVEWAEEATLGATERGAGGFGSTGVTDRSSAPTT